MDILYKFSQILWGYPLILLLSFGGIFLTIKLNFFQFRYFFYILKTTFFSIHKKPKGTGTVTPFQAISSTLACTVGAGNIIGVPAAIVFGGPGAIFWMWVIALFGMATKFTEAALAVCYRTKNKKNEYVGGPMYYMTRGLKMKWLAIWFSTALMIEVIPSVMIQGNSIAGSALSTFNIPPYITGLIIMFIVSLVIIGGIKRIGHFAEVIVPFMAIIYIGSVIIVFIMSIEEFPKVLALIFKNAFTAVAPIGGFAGATLIEVIRWGAARGAYSNEAGVGTAPIAHATATTDHPTRQGLWAMVGILVDTIIVCTATAYVILASDIWKAEFARTNTSGLTALAFENFFGPYGSLIVTISLIFFVISTIIVLSWYGEKQAEFLFGDLGAKIIKYVYVISAFVGAIGAARFIWNLIDLALAMAIIPNMIALLLLSNKAKKLKEEFFNTPNRYYLNERK
ncbi:MAG: sodium:alanine symporter family protein [Deferribacterota bacterium]|nr:sodium:alanine symporter family protein [Deferribacterota bacterium]